MDSSSNSSANGIHRTGALRRIELGASETPAPGDFGSMFGSSAAMQRVFRLSERLAESDLTVLVEGETGTGKELLARTLHTIGARRDRPLVVLDCAAIDDDELVSLLFGETCRTWLAEEAGGGTLVIDEVLELSDEAQATLVRFLDRREGGVRGVEAVVPDVRIIATSRGNVDAAVKAKRFREELFFRLSASRVSLPPLRERGSDVELLAEHFWGTVAPPERRFSADFLARYARHSWSGNVRELRNLIIFAAELSALGVPDPEPLPEPVVASPERPSVAALMDEIEAVLKLDLPLGAARARVVSAFEGRYVARSLAQTGGNVSHSAKRAGVARRYFQILRARTAKASAGLPSLSSPSSSDSGSVDAQGT